MRLLFLLLILLSLNIIKAMGKLIAADLDGTLFYPKHRIKMISKKALNFIRNRIDQGDYFCVVSGRNSNYGYKVQEKIGRPIGIIGCNGSVIVHQDNVIKQDSFDPKTAREAIEWIRENLKPKGFFVMASDNTFTLEKYFKNPFYNLGYFMWYFMQGVYREPMKTSKEKFDSVIDGGRAVKIMIMFGIGQKNIKRASEANKIIYKQFGDKLTASWSDEFIELSPKEANKSNGLQFYADYLKINHDDVFVVGDSGNDISMFKEFPKHSFCMKHAQLSVSKYASNTVDRFEDIENYLEERK